MLAQARLVSGFGGSCCDGDIPTTLLDRSSSVDGCHRGFGLSLSHFHSTYIQTLTCPLLLCPAWLLTHVHHLPAFVMFHSNLFGSHVCFTGPSLPRHAAYSFSCVSAWRSTSTSSQITPSSERAYLLCAISNMRITCSACASPPRC